MTRPYAPCLHCGGPMFPQHQEPPECLLCGRSNFRLINDGWWAQYAHLIRDGKNHEEISQSLH